MNILFVYPIECPGFNDVGYHHGLGSIAAVLKDAGHAVELFVARAFHPTGIDTCIDRVNPRLIGIYAASDQMTLVARYAGYIYDRYGLPVILGGPHPTAAPDESIGLKGVTGICRGEGEYAVRDLVTALERQKDISRIKNFWFNKNGHVIKNEVGPLIEDLDSLPYADREMFDYQKIINDRKFKDAEVMSSRGCLYNCPYCVNNFLHKLYRGKGRLLRRRSVEHVIGELEQLAARYTFNRITFHDDIFTLEEEYLSRFCKEYKSRINMPFGINARPEVLNENVMRLLKRAGCDTVCIGIESGNVYLRNRLLRRNLTDGQIKRAFQLCDTYRIRTFGLNLIGLPGEDEHTVRQTIALNRQVRPTFPVQFVFRPYPGTELYDTCVRQGLISERKVKAYNEGKTILDLPTISGKKICYYHNVFYSEVKRNFLLPVVRILAGIHIKDTTLYLLLYPYYRKMYYKIRPFSRFFHNFLRKVFSGTMGKRTADDDYVSTHTEHNRV